MNFTEQIRSFTSQQASKMIVELLDRVTDKRLVQLTHLGEKLTSDDEVLNSIKAIRRFLESPDHSTKDLFRKVIDYLPKQNRVRIFHTLFNNAWFVGGKKRDFYEENYGFRPPFIMILSPTWRCNLRCAGCYTLGQQRHPGLEYDLVKRILKEARELGIYFITILGGEPFVYPHLFQMLEDHPDIFFQVYTNGTLMNQETAHRFAEFGNVAVVVSCEGYEEETDRWRGKGVYRKLMDAMDYLREARVILGSSATVTKHNVETVASDAFIDKLVDKGVVAQMYFLYLPVNGQGDINLGDSNLEASNLDGSGRHFIVRHIGHHVFIGTDTGWKYFRDIRVCNYGKTIVYGSGCNSIFIRSYLAECKHKSKDTVLIIFQIGFVITRAHSPE